MFTPDNKTIREILDRIFVPEAMQEFNKRMYKKGSDKNGIKKELREYMQARIKLIVLVEEFHIDASKSMEHMISDAETRLARRFEDEAKEYQNWQDKYLPEKMKVNKSNGMAARPAMTKIPTPPPRPESPYAPKDDDAAMDPRFVAPHVTPQHTLPEVAPYIPVTVTNETVIKETTEVVKPMINHDIIIPPRFRVQPNFVQPYHQSPCGKYKGYQIDWRLLPVLCKNGLGNWRTAILDPANEMYYNDLMSILFIVQRDGEIVLKENRRDTFFILR